MSYTKVESEIELTNDISRELAPVSSVVGELVGVNDNGEPLVSYSQILSSSPVSALSALSADDVSSISSFPVKVMITFDNGRCDHPIIAGLIKTKLFSMDVLTQESKAKKDLESDSGQQVTNIVSSASNALITEVDGKKIILTGKEEILLKCGKSSILMRRDGKIVIKGSNITSRSSSAHKIKGSSVSIN